MDLGNDNLDFMKLVNIKGNVENVTPHKIAVVAFIREYGLLKVEGVYLHILNKVHYIFYNSGAFFLLNQP